MINFEDRLNEFRKIMKNNIMNQEQILDDFSLKLKQIYVYLLSLSNLIEEASKEDSVLYENFHEVEIEYYKYLNQLTYIMFELYKGNDIHDNLYKEIVELSEEFLKNTLNKFFEINSEILYIEVVIYSARFQIDSFIYQFKIKEIETTCLGEIKEAIESKRNIIIYQKEEKKIEEFNKKIHEEDILSKEHLIEINKLWNKFKKFYLYDLNSAK